MVRFKWIPGTRKYEVGERCAQLIVRPIIETEIEEKMGEFEKTARGDGGYGSTGEK